VPGSARANRAVPNRARAVLARPARLDNYNSGFSTRYEMDEGRLWQLVFMGEGVSPRRGDAARSRADPPGSVEIAL
jgi:hypothetical protein